MTMNMTPNKPDEWTKKRRGEWQEERGPRHGNNRKWKAKEKWRDRKRSRREKWDYIDD